MKYGDITKAKREFYKCVEESQWAKALIKDVVEKLEDKNYISNSESSQDKIHQLIAKLYRACRGTEDLKPVCNVAQAYLDCAHIIAKFEKSGKRELAIEYDEKKNYFVHQKNIYSAKTKKIISSSKSILENFITDIEEYFHKKDKDSLKAIDNAQNAIGTPKHIDNIELNNLKYDRTTMPRAICIGKHTPGDDAFSKKLFSEGSNAYATLNLQRNGNLYIRDLDNEPRTIDKFIVAYVFTCLNRFPLGALNVHIIDKNPNITSFLENKINGTINKKILTVYKDFSILDRLNDTVCRDVSKKISSDSRNVYELYEKDKNEEINLVIIKEDLSQDSGYEMEHALEKIKILSGDYGHNCGVRFLLIDTAKENKANQNDQFSSIKSNCGIIVKKIGNKYSIAGLNFDPICFCGDELEFIEAQSKKVVELLSQRQKNSTSYEDIVGENTPVVLNDAILRIPVGRSANKIVEMPFSCKNISGTAEGMCVSYMVIGATGSGKSSLFDSIVMCGCLKYAPSDLKFWLLDFKDGVSTEKYKHSKLPHISVVADRNSPSDALALFDMVIAEMQSRKEAFSRFSGCSDLYTYNQYADRKQEPRLPRIIILIDEIQEIANCEYWSDIRDKLLAISNRIRAFGMHLVMIAQNLSDGKNNHLQDLLSQVNGRICFRIDNEETLRNSSFGESFTERFSEIKNLGQGEIYLKYGNMDDPQKLQLAYVAPTLFESQYFPTIQKKYNCLSSMKVVGELSKLEIDSRSNSYNVKYYQLFSKLRKMNELTLLIGEDSYTHEPLSISLSARENSSVCFIGSNKKMSNSLMISAVASLIGKSITTYVFNGDSYDTTLKDFVADAETDDGYIFYRTRGEILDVLTSVYAQFLDRRKMEDDEIDVDYEPIVLCLNDATGIRAVRENLTMDECSDEDSYDIKNVSKVINELATEGYRYKIFVIIGLTEDTFDEQMVSNISKMVLYHNSNFIPNSVNSMVYSDMMQSIGGDGAESLALYLSNKVLTKFRPILYDVNRHQKTLEILARGTKK